MSRAHRVEKLEAKRAEQQRVKDIAVSFGWDDSASEIPPSEQGSGKPTAVTIRLRRPAPGLEPDADGGLRLTVGIEPKGRNGKPVPSPEPGSREWYVATGQHLGANFTEAALGNPSTTISFSRESPRPEAVGIGFKPLRWGRGR